MMETRVEFPIPGNDFSLMYELEKKINSILEAEGLEWQFSEVTFMGLNSREIGYKGETSKEEEIKTLGKEYGVEVRVDTFETDDGEE